MDAVDLLGGGGDEHRPSLENRVAFQWRDRQDTLAHLHATRRDELVLRWLTEAIERGTPPKAALDVGCAYGNHSLMLNARLRRDESVAIRGVDLHEPHLAFGTAFAREVPGYGNCEFSKGDLTAGLPFDEATFDAVCLADVLEHLERPVDALRELRRVTKPGGTIVISTPLKTSLFKVAATSANKLTRGRIYRRYYAGKGTYVNEEGAPVMDVAAGHDHISEMTLAELRGTVREAGLTVGEIVPMGVMSGSRWFESHPFLLAGFMLLEAVHSVLRRPSWAHSVLLRLTR